MSIKELLRKLWNPNTEKAFVEETDGLFYYLLADQLANRTFSKAEILQIIAILKSNVSQYLELENGTDEVLSFEGGADLLGKMRNELEPYYVMYKLSEIRLHDASINKNEDEPVNQPVRTGLSRKAQDYLNRFIRRLDQQLGDENERGTTGLK